MSDKKTKTGMEYIANYLLALQEKQNEFNSEDSDIIVYRGHADESYEFKPSLFRNGNEKIYQQEAEILRKLEVERPNEFSGLKTFDKLVKMQDYNFATRILDVTSNPLVALYFAAQRSSLNANGTVTICRIPQEFVNYFDDSPVISLANVIAGV